MFPYRLGESQADQSSVKEACAQNVQCVEADRVPHTNMRSQLLPGEKKKKKLHDLGHGSSKDALFFKFTAAVIKCQRASTYFPIGGGAGSLASGYGDFVGVDSQAGEEEADMESVERFRLNIKRGA